MAGLGPARRVAAGIALLALAATGFVSGRVLLRPRTSVAQPIAFNHRLHTASIECETCHEFVRKGAHSGLPGLSTCLQCHEQPQTDKAEEKKINQLAAAGQEQVFRKLFHLPDNVFYSHRRHVAIAKLECATCHGAIARTETPPAAPLVRITMDFCRDCHRKSGVSVGCTRCHR
jgi:hypothetical protein